MQRQGDLLILKICDIPAAAKSIVSRVLAEGEVTGHLHELDVGTVYALDDQLFFEVSHGHPATLTHPEHHSLVFTPGRYRVIRQREYEPGGWRNVSD